MASSTRIIEGSISQYTGGGGQSSCTSIATFAALSLLPILDAGSLESITPVMIDRLVHAGIATHGAKEHVSCSDIIGSPPFAGWTNYLLFETPRSSGDPHAINAILEEAYTLPGFDPARYRGIVLTSRMESFLVGLPPHGSGRPFMLFDSHTRGASLARVVLFPTTAALNAYIYATIFPAISSEGLPPDYLGIDATVLQGPGGGGAGGGGAAAAEAEESGVFGSSSTLGPAAVGGAGGGSSAAPSVHSGGAAAAAAAANDGGAYFGYSLSSGPFIPAGKVGGGGSGGGAAAAAPVANASIETIISKAQDQLSAEEISNILFLKTQLDDAVKGTIEYNRILSQIHAELAKITPFLVGGARRRAPRRSRRQRRAPRRARRRATRRKDL
jgi:hypothetical protein